MFNNILDKLAAIKKKRYSSPGFQSPKAPPSYSSPGFPSQPSKMSQPVYTSPGFPSGPMRTPPQYPIPNYGPRMPGNMENFPITSPAMPVRRQEAPPVYTSPGFPSGPMRQAPPMPTYGKRRPGLEDFPMTRPSPR